MAALEKRFNPPATEAAAEVEGDDAPAADPEQSEGTQDAPATDDAPAEEEGQDESQPDLSTVKVPVTYKGDDGEDVTEEMPLDEVRAGYMRSRDYTIKTKEVAQARAAIPQAVEQGVAEARNTYSQELQKMHALVTATVAPELQGIDWQKLAQENPAEYVAKSARFQQVNQILQSISQQHDAEQQRTFAARKAQADQEAASSVEVLKTAIPNFTLEKYKGLIDGAVREYGKYGVKAEEVAGITGAAPFLIINDALAYRALMSKKPAAQKQVAAAPVAIKPGVSKTRAEANQARIAPLKSALAKSGDLEDAVALYAARNRR